VRRGAAVSQAAPASAAGGLVVVAAALALALVRPRARWLPAVVLALGGGLVVASAASIVSDPSASAVVAAREVVGVGTLTGPAAVTPLPWVAALIGLAVVALALAVAVTGRRWPVTSDRHVRPTTEVAASGAGGALHDGGDGAGDEGRGGDDRGDDHSAWDALSRGEDPT
jgi:hypothetical protein